MMTSLNMETIIRILRVMGSILFALLVLLPVSARAEYQFGPFISSDTDLAGEKRFRLFGPIVERQEHDNGVFFALRPLNASVTDTHRNRKVRDILWPLAMIKDLDNETSVRFLIFFGHDFERKEATRHRVHIYPFYYQGRSSEGERYWALFPLGGKICEFLGRDKMVFFLFPLYSYTRINDVKTHTVLWPIFSVTKGADVSRLKVWPLYGVSKREGRYTKSFALWPIWTHARYYGEGHSGYAYVLFPLFGRVKMDKQSSVMILPPLFRWSKSEDYWKLNCPWPFLRFAGGPNYSKTYIWPIWGNRKTEFGNKWFFLWPVLRGERLALADGGRVRRFRIFPLLAYESVKGRENPALNSKFVKVWPLFSYRRKGEVAQYRMLSLWPARNNQPIERNWAPFWSIYSHHRNGDRIEDEVLWGLFSHRRESGKSRNLQLFPLMGWKTDQDEEKLGWSVFKGLIAYDRVGERRRYRILYIPIGSLRE